MSLQFAKRSLITAMLIVACAFHATAEQQYINGYYRSHTATTLTLLENDYLKRITIQRTFDYDTTLRIDGCSLADVQPGTTINAVFDTEKKVLQTVLFDRCAQRVDVYGVVESNDGSTFSLRNTAYDTPFGYGKTITVSITEQTLLSSCLGLPIESQALTPGTVVSVSGFRSGAASVEALTVFGQVGCPADVSSTGTFVALTDTSVTLDVVALGRVEFMFGGRHGGSSEVDTSSFPLIACWTEPIAWSSLTESDTLIVSGQVYPDGTGILNFLVPTRNCPPGISIAIGFNGYAVVTGRISALTDSLVQVQGILGGTITLATSTPASADPTLYYSCAGQPITRDDFAIGDSVYVIFANEEADRSIRQLIRISDCVQQITIRGTVVSVSDSEWALLTELGNDVRLAIDTNSVVYDCVGSTVAANDARLAGYTVYANAWVVSGDLALLTNATAEGTCGDFESVSGVVTSVDADSISINTDEGIKTLRKPAQVYVYSIDNGYGSWSDIVVGEAICATLSRGLFNVTTMYVFNGYTCDGRPTSEVVSTKGIVREVSAEHLEIETNGTTVRFKVTSSTQVSGAYSHRTLTPGTRVDVSSMLAEASIEPTAMSVAVLRNTTTSVKEDKAPTSSTWLVPNPASDVLRATSIERVRSIQIASLDGTIVASEQGSQTISVASLANGPYMAIIHDMTGTVRTQLLHVLH